MNLLSILLQAAAPAAGGITKYSGVFLLIAILIIAIMLIKGKKESLTDKEEISISDVEINKVINVSLNGGIIGLLSESPQRKLNSRIKKENINGWKVTQIIQADSGNIFLAIFRLLLLIITLFLFTTVNGYYIILEKK